MNNEQQRTMRLAVVHYLEQLRHGDLHSVATAGTVQNILQQLGETLQDFNTSEEELEGYIQDGRRMAAAMLLVMGERRELNDQAIIHFFAFQLRYGTKNYREVMEFIRETAERSSIPLKIYDAAQSKLEKIIQGCYATVAKNFVQLAQHNQDIHWLDFLKEVISEGELDSQKHLGISNTNVYTLRTQIRAAQLIKAKEALTCLRGTCFHGHVPEMMNPSHHQVLAARYSGELTLSELGLTEVEMQEIISAYAREATLRSRAHLN